MFVFVFVDILRKKFIITDHTIGTDMLLIGHEILTAKKRKNRKILLTKYPLS